MKRRFRVKVYGNRIARNSPHNKHFRIYDEKELVPDDLYRNDLFIESLNDLECGLSHIPRFYFIMSKDPYSWLVSYMRWAKKCGWREPGFHYATEYQLFYKKWLDIGSEDSRVFFIRYIDLLIDPESVISDVKKKCGLEDRLLSFLMSKRVAKVGQSSTFTDDRMKYYKDKRYLADIDESDVNHINSIVSQDVLRGLGYAYEVL